MTTSKWTTEAEYFELRVAGGNVAELRLALDDIEQAATEWGADVATWATDGDAVVMRFPGSTKSVGGWPAEEAETHG